jgi:hypothetical protein
MGWACGQDEKTGNAHRSLVRNPSRKLKGSYDKEILKCMLIKDVKWRTANLALDRTQPGSLPINVLNFGDIFPVTYKDTLRIACCFILGVLDDTLSS